MTFLPRDRLILRLNEVYHDLENQDYEGKYPDIEEEEAPRWDRFGSELLAGPRTAWDIFDFGTGTGFVPRKLKNVLQRGDRLTCSDLSASMLEACRRNLVAAGLDCGMHFLKLDGARIDLPDRSQEAVTANAVMHHLADPAAVCREIDRILKPGGAVLIGHEPNRAHYDRAALVWNYRLLLPIADPKLFAYEVILRMGLFESLRGPLGRWVPELRAHNRLLERVNERLLAEGAIDRPLPAAELSSLLDAQSPTAGGMHAERGFTRAEILSWFPGYAMHRCETYKHLNKIHPRAAWLKRYEDGLAKRYPDDGSSLFCRLRKPA